MHSHLKSSLLPPFSGIAGSAANSDAAEAFGCVVQSHSYNSKSALKNCD